MTPARCTAAVVLASAVLLVAGCSSGSSGPTASPGTPATSPNPTTSPTTTPTTSPTTTPTPEVEDPIVFGSMGGVSCSEVQGALLLVDQFEVLRPMTLTDLDLPDTTGVDLGDVTISRKHQGDLDLAGGWLGTEPEDARKDDLRWAQREPLAGAAVEPGWYHYFLPLDLDGVARFRGVEIAWRDGASDGSSRQTANEIYRKSCR